MNIIRKGQWPSAMTIASILICLDQCGLIAADFQRISVGNISDFTNMVVHRDTGTVYLAGVNVFAVRRYNTSKGYLETTGHIILGFNRSRSDCEPWASQECSSRNTRSKGLVIDYANERLITCWNVPAGRCEKRHLEDTLKLDGEIPEALVPFDQDASTSLVATDGSNGTLYVAATYGKSSWAGRIPAIAMRKMSDFSLVGNFSSLRFKPELRDSFKVDYIYGFSHAGFVYFVTVQKPKEGDNSTMDYITKLVRVCEGNVNISISYYAEIPLKCSHERETYNIATSAYFHIDSAVGDNSTGCGSSLMVTMSTSQPGTKEPGRKSAVCEFSMKDIEESYTSAFQRCFNGEGSTGPSYVMGNPEQCHKKDIPIGPGYCGTRQTAYNSHVDGRTPVTGRARFHSDDETYTALAVSTVQRHRLVLVGTSRGKVHLFGGKNTSQPCRTFNDFSLEEHEGEPILQLEMAQGPVKGHFHALTDKSHTFVQDDLSSLCTFDSELECPAPIGNNAKAVVNQMWILILVVSLTLLG